MKTQEQIADRIIPWLSLLAGFALVVVTLCLNGLIVAIIGLFAFVIINQSQILFKLNDIEKRIKSRKSLFNYEVKR